MSETTPLYQDPSAPIEARVDDLVGRMTLHEKIQQMSYGAPAIPRLDVPAYNWWNECLHGVGRAGTATVFPQAIGMAASWNTSLLHTVADAISTEARAKYHDAIRQGKREQYYGLTFWTPNINIFRDPRWGRGQETYGEDPYFMARMAVAFITGLQGNDERYMKIAACAKHYAVHSGPEAERHEFDALASTRELWDTYLPAFESAVREAGVESVMGAYNRTNGHPCNAHPDLMGEILRGQWQFDGHYVSDCWAIKDFYLHHKIVDTPEEAAALAVNTGCDLNCGDTYPALVAAHEQGLVTEEAITTAVKRLFRTRMRLGMFDPDEHIPYASIPIERNDSPEHRALALEMARESMVLLKNDGLLPLQRGTHKTIAVIGPNAADELVMFGNYNGFPSQTTTALDGIRARLNGSATVEYAQGCLVAGENTAGYDEAVALAERADLVIFVGGLSQWLEGEEGQHESVPDGEQSQGDRTHIELPPVQQTLLERIHATGTPTILVLYGGSAIAIPWADAHLPAILMAWYPGQDGGAAVADVLYGDYNPAGRLPVTFYASTDDLPDFRDYSMENRTYRYFTGEALYPFGHGLSYTTFAYSDLRFDRATIDTGESITLSADVTNTGDRAGDEVVQVYVTDMTASTRVPLRSLRGFTRIHLKPGERKTVTFTLAPADLAFVDENGYSMIEPGEFTITVGGRQPIPGTSGDDVVSGVLTVTGAAQQVSRY